MITYIKKFISRIIVRFKPKEVQPLSAANAQSLDHYNKVYSYDNMINHFLDDIFKDIKRSAKYHSKYTIVNIPDWMTDVSYDYILVHFRTLGYIVIEAKELQLLIISWK